MLTGKEHTYQGKQLKREGKTYLMFILIILLIIIRIPIMY